MSQKIISYEIGPPPRRCSKSPQDAPTISDLQPTKNQDVILSQREHDENAKSNPLPSPSPQVSDAAAATQRVPASVKKPESKKRPGRPADPTSSLPRIFDSINQCSAVTGVPVSALREAKKAGCPAFRHSRVDLIEFLRWRFGLPEDAVGDWGEALKEYKAKREKIALDKDLDLILSKSDVSFAVGKALSMLFSNIDAQFGQLLPPALKGLDEAGIQARLLAAAETFKKTIRAELEKFAVVEKVNKPNSKT